MKKKKNRTSKKGYIILSILLVLVIAFNTAAQIFSGYIDLYLGRGEAIITKTEGTENWDSTYYKMDYENAKALQEAANAVVEQKEGEGIVLLKNNGR